MDSLHFKTLPSGSASPYPFGDTWMGIFQPMGFPAGLCLWQSPRLQESLWHPRVWPTLIFSVSIWLGWWHWQKSGRCSSGTGLWRRQHSHSRWDISVSGELLPSPEPITEATWLSKPFCFLCCSSCLHHLYSLPLSLLSGPPFPPPTFSPSLCPLCLQVAAIGDLLHWWSQIWIFCSLK